MLTIPSHYARALLRPLSESGGDDLDVLRELGISAEIFRNESARLHVEQFVQLVQRVSQRLDDEFFALSGTQCQPGYFGVYLRYVSQFGTLRTIVEETVRFFNTTRSDVLLGFKHSDDEISFSVQLSNLTLDVDHYLVEHLLVSMHRFFCWVTDQRIVLNSADFAYREPAHGTHYRWLFACPYAFEKSENSIKFRSEYLGNPNVRTWNEFSEYLRNAPADTMAIPGADNSLSAQIKGILLDRLKNNAAIPDFQTIADTLCTSQQTLRRKLVAEQTSYQQIKNAIRQEIAIDKLVRSKLPVAEIGARLGFVEPASFTRAFKNWTGVSPMEYRTQSET